LPLSSSTLVLSVLALVLLANAAPVIARFLLGDHFGRPIDGGRRFSDGRPVLGGSKTYRGVAAAVVLTVPAAELVDVGGWVGLIIAVMAMAGDLLSSFVKRRVGKPVHARVFLLDDVPEGLLPVLAIAGPLGLTWLDGLAAVTGFVTVHSLLERIAVRSRLRRRRN
jgi:CDP-2,3-bis-(O-geranylgeranyl)-sn-glycerol synthase